MKRKSSIGQRACSKTPRTHHLPAWSTVPPIAVEVLVEAETIGAMRRVLRGMVLLVTDSAVVQQAARAEQLDSIDDARLAAIAQEALANFKRSKAGFDDLEASFLELRKELERIRKDNALEERALLEAQKAVKERDDIAAKYKELQKQIDPEKRQLEVMYAIDEATASVKEETIALRRELGQRQTEIETLRVSKKRLREALDRLAGKD